MLESNICMEPGCYMILCPLCLEQHKQQETHTQQSQNLETVLLVCQKTLQQHI